MNRDTFEALLLEAVAESIDYKGGGRVKWGLVAQKMGYDTPEKWRSAYRRIRSREELPVGVRKRLLDVGIENVEKMRAAGYNVQVWAEGEVLYCMKMPVQKVGNEDINKLYQGTEVKIAALSCTHFGHKNAAIKELHEFYQYAYSQGVRDFYHCGDMTDGMYKNRDNSFYEQNAIGFTNQLHAVRDNYPRIPGVTTHFITGNHDATHMRNGGADMGVAIEQVRPDLHYEGHNFGLVNLTENATLALVHAADKGTQGVSWSMQKFINESKGRRHANIVLMGHYHKMNWIYFKGVHGFTMPSFEHQTDFMASMNAESYVGGYILTIKFDVDGKILTVLAEYVDYTQYQ